MSLAFATLLATCLTQTPTWSVAVTRREGMTPEKGLEIAQAFSLALARQTVTPMGTRLSPHALRARLALANTPDAATCSGAVDCAVRLGVVARVQRLVALELAKEGTNIVMAAALIEVAEARVVAGAAGIVSLKAPGKGMDYIAAALARTASTRPPAATAAAAPTDVPSVPLAETKATAAQMPKPEGTPPGVLPAPPLVVERTTASVAVPDTVTAPQASSRVPAWVASAGALAAAGTAAAFGGIGVAQQGSMAPLDGRSPMPYSEAETTARRANDSFTVAAVAAGGAVVMGVAAAILFLASK